MVAYADKGGQLGPHGSDGLARMVVPGDLAGGRYVSDLVDLDVRSLPEPRLRDQVAFRTSSCSQERWPTQPL